MRIASLPHGPHRAAGRHRVPGRRRIAGVAVAALLALAAPARAGRNIGVVVTGESWMQSQLAAQIEAWLSQHGHTLVPSAMPAEAVNALNDCFVMGDQGCARAVVEKAARTTSVLYARVDARNNGSDAPDLTVTAYWFDRGHDAIGEKTTCQRCSDQSLRNTAEEILRKLIGGGDLGHVNLKSAPPGARITIDGTAIGVTPLDWDLPPGKHTIQMDLAGRRRTVRNHVVVSNKSDLVVMTLPAEDEREEAPSRTVPLALVIGGGTAVVAGAGLIAFSPGPDPRQRFYTRTWPAGIAVAAGGAAVGALGAYLLWFRSPEPGAASVASIRTRSGPARSVPPRSVPPRSVPVASFSGDAGYIGWLGQF